MSSYEVRVATIPEGLPRPADLTVVRTPVPAAGPGEVLVRNRFFAALRTLLNAEIARLTELRDSLAAHVDGRAAASCRRGMAGHTP
ncbi:hypothetical protein Aca07nite_83360 [Actinoplanes capillaceus]|uniref:Uncharacterized protein n=1 Tax=Actinoplanes campanulatus TaxID=113559 RepID=A0ABQ3WXP0_9ACTN|nr:hypothetical protein [Actinoplanes capillaceus]GID51061.1 hypothetical protein Aca07nite_83360 [Actinoplanes capillaceus]